MKSNVIKIDFTIGAKRGALDLHVTKQPKAKLYAFVKKLTLTEIIRNGAHPTKTGTVPR